MAKGSEPTTADDRSAAQLAGWIDAHFGLLRGVSELRELGPEAEEAVATVLSVRSLRQIRLSWELWSAIAGDQGVDVEALLVDHIPALGASGVLRRRR